MHLDHGLPHHPQHVQLDGARARVGEGLVFATPRPPSSYLSRYCCCPRALSVSLSPLPPLPPHPPTSASSSPFSSSTFLPPPPNPRAPSLRGGQVDTFGSDEQRASWLRETHGDVWEAAMNLGEIYN